MFKIGFFQFNPEFGKVESNLAKVISALSGVQADMVVLPELSFTGYFFKNRDELKSMAEDLKNSSTVESLKAFCREKDFYIVTGFAEKAADRLFNSSLLIGPGGIIHTYRKLHLFNTEKDCFDPGDTPLEVNSVRSIKLGMMICFDWVFPETARILALKGADLLCHPSNLVLTHCQQAMLTRSLENSVFSVTANRYGIESRPHGNLSFTGQSQIVDSKGKLLHRANAAQDELHVIEIDVDEARDKRLTEKNNLFKDRRPGFYGEIVKTGSSI